MQLLLLSQKCSPHPPAISTSPYQAFCYDGMDDKELPEDQCQRDRSMDYQLKRESQAWDLGVASSKTADYFHDVS